MKGANNAVRGKKGYESLQFLNDYMENQEEMTKISDDFKSLENLRKILDANTA